MTEQTAESLENTIVPTLLFNIEGSQILLPDIAIAEIIDYQMTANEDDDKPDWYLGQLEWRGLSVPLVSLESMNHGAFFTKRPALKIIVVNALNNLKEQGYWAFVSLDTPRLQRLNHESLVSSDEPLQGDIALMMAELMGEELMIPNLAQIEENISQLKL